MTAYLFLLLFPLCCSKASAHLIQTGDRVMEVEIVGKYPHNHLGASSVYIRGDGCGLTWVTGNQLHKTTTDTWTITVSCTAGAQVSVKLLVDDAAWMMGKNKVFRVDGEPVYIYPCFQPKINPIWSSSIRSHILQNSRKISIYYPPSYHDNSYKQYQVLVLHDGQNLFNNSEAAFGVAWMCQDTANSYIGAGKMEEIVMVGVWNTPDRGNEYTYSYDHSVGFGGKGDKYLDFLEQELIPLLEGELLQGRTLGYGIGGSSLGGLISCYALYTRPKVWKKAVCMSSSFWWNNQDFLNTILTTDAPSNTSIYIDSGDTGATADGMNETISVRDKLCRIGYEMNTDLFYYLDHGGQHNEYYWGHRFNHPLEALYP